MEMLPAKAKDEKKLTQEGIWQDSRIKIAIPRFP